jgi:hypothetical protein
MKSIAFTTSPFQLINAVELSHTLKDSTTYIYFLRHDYEEASIKSIEKIYKVKTWIIRQKKSPLRPFNIQIKDIFKILSATRDSQIKNLYFGFFNSRNSFFINTSSNVNKTYYVDDGAITLKFFEKNKVINKIYHKIQTIPTNRLYYNDTIFFSIYNKETKKNIIKNELIITKNIKNLSTNKDPIVIGTNFFDKVSSVEDIFIKIKKIIGKSFLYIPHRRNNPEKIYYLADKLGFQVYVNDLPLEAKIYTIWSPEIDCYSMPSTAASTFEIITSCKEVNIIDFSNLITSDDYRKSTEMLLTKLNKFKIIVI